jgi:hypothetical protein
MAAISGTTHIKTIFSFSPVFLDKKCLLRNPRRKKSTGVKSVGERHELYSRSEAVHHGGAKTVPTATWRRSVFPIIDREVSHFTASSGVKKGPVTLLFITACHTLSVGESRSCSVTSCEFSHSHARLFCLLTVPLTWNVASIKKHSLPNSA